MKIDEFGLDDRKIIPATMRPGDFSGFWKENKYFFGNFFSVENVVHTLKRSGFRHRLVYFPRVLANFFNRK